VGALVNSNAVRVRGEESFSDLFQVAAMLIEDRDDAALSGNVQTTKALIKGEHVRISANGLNSGHFLGFKIKDRQLRILFAGDECQTVFTINQEAVAPAAPWKWIAYDDLVLARINLSQFILLHPAHQRFSNGSAIHTYNPAYSRTSA